MHTAIELRNRGFKVVAVDNRNDYYSPQLKADRVELLKEAGASFVKADVCDEAAFDKIIKDYEVERVRVVHLAAQAGVRFSLKSPHSYTSNNVDCFVSVLEQVVKAGLQDKPIVYASSSNVYGFNNNAPFTEGVSDDSLHHKTSPTSNA
jgi:UDP-glucuronate 4-epimerase